MVKLSFDFRSTELAMSCTHRSRQLPSLHYLVIVTLQCCLTPFRYNLAARRLLEWPQSTHSQYVSASTVLARRVIGQTRTWLEGPQNLIPHSAWRCAHGAVTALPLLPAEYHTVLSCAQPCCKLLWETMQARA